MFPEKNEPLKSARALKVGRLAVGALAFGAVAMGALAMGAVAIGRLVIGRSKMRHLEIKELVVGRLRVTEAFEVPTRSAEGQSGKPESNPKAPSYSRDPSDLD